MVVMSVPAAADDPFTKICTDALLLLTDITVKVTLAAESVKL
jgi:hypothetical protein